MRSLLCLVRWIGLSAAGCVVGLPLIAQVPASERVPVTDSNELQRMGFPPDAKNVYRWTRFRQVDESDQAAEASPTDFGQFSHYTALAPKAFIGRADVTGFNWAWDGGFNCCVDLDRVGTEKFADAQVLLPDGASLDFMRWWAYDADVTNDMDFFVFEDCQPSFSAGDTTITFIASSATSGSSGFQSGAVSMSGLTINNRDCTYLARVLFNGTGTTNTLQKIRFEWHRQVSPAPAIATFADVPTSSPQFKFVEALVAAGITAGCGGGNYCPNDAVTRGQMAVFLSVALGLYFP